MLARGDEAPTVVPSVEHDRPLQDALALMLERHSPWVAVTEDGRYLGLLGINDFWHSQPSTETSALRRGRPLPIPNSCAVARPGSSF